MGGVIGARLALCGESWATMTRSFPAKAPCLLADELLLLTAEGG